MDFYQEDLMVAIRSPLHKQILDWAHDQVRASADHEAGPSHSKGSEFYLSKLGFLGAVVVGAITTAKDSLVGLVRTGEAKVLGHSLDGAEDAWDRAGAALQSVFDGMTGIVDSQTILTRQEMKNIAAISVYGKQLSELNDIPPEVRKTLTEQLKKARLYVQKGGDQTEDEVTHLFQVFDTVKHSPVGAAEKLRNMKWTKQSK